MRVEESTTLRCRPAAVWQYVGDPQRYPEFMAGVTRWQHLRDGEKGVLGSRYSMRLRVGSADVGGEVEIVEYREPCDVAWTAVTGVNQRGRWRVREVDPGVVRVTLRIAYQSPGGLWGLLADRVAAGQIRADLRRTLQALSEKCAGDANAHTTGGARPIDAGLQQLRSLAVLTRAGVIRPHRPDRIVAAAFGLHQWGLTLPGGYAAAASLVPDRVAIIDDAGTLTFADVDRRSGALAAGLAASGVREGDRVAVLCRNHRGIVEATVALGKLGTDVLYVNSGFAAPQLADVMRREEATAIVHDEEFGALVGNTIPARRRFVAWRDSSRVRGTLCERLIDKHWGDEPEPPERSGRVTLLTSGTTGTPRGATRPQASSVEPAAAILSRIPLRAQEPTLVAAPIFHSWGAAHLGLGVILSSTLVLQRRFDPEATLAAIEEHGVTALAAVPVMLQRLLDVPARARSRYDTSSLRVVAVSGSALSPELAQRFMDAYGDVLYNLYGSTEVAWATIATPDELREAPGTAGRPPAGTVVRLLDESGNETPPGKTGRIFVGHEMLFEGYTGGGSKDMVDGLMATGDVGHVDDDGLLFVEGRDDEMIVSGGENVFPAEVEDLLHRHDAIAEAAVLGVPDEEWGQRLRAYVVKRRGATLSESAVRDYVRSHLARYKVPRDVVFIASLPRNPTGKVVKRELPDVDGSAPAPRRRATSARPRRRVARRRHPV